MEALLASPRANVPVVAGPPALDSWCVVANDPTGNLVRPAGTIAYHVGGLLAWVNVDGTAAGWLSINLLAGLPRLILDWTNAGAAVVSHTWPFVSARWQRWWLNVSGLASPPAASGYAFLRADGAVSGLARSQGTNQYNGAFGNYLGTDFDAITGFFGTAMVGGVSRMQGERVGGNWLVHAVNASVAPSELTEILSAYLAPSVTTLAYWCTDAAKTGAYIAAGARIQMWGVPG